MGSEEARIAAFLDQAIRNGSCVMTHRWPPASVINSSDTIGPVPAFWDHFVLFLGGTGGGDSTAAFLA